MERTIELINLELEEAYAMAKHEDAIRQGERIRKLAKLWDCNTKEASKTIARMVDVQAYATACKAEDTL